MIKIIRKLKSLLCVSNPLLRSESCHRYEYSVEITSDSAAANIIRMVGHGRKVLEIGAGPGSITRILNGQNQCQVTAIEIDDSAIEKLQMFCHRVVKLDLNMPDWQDALASDDPFEVIVIADVLEHLLDPWQTLAAVKMLLTPDGYLVVSLPHVSHNVIMACLLNEDFEYRNFGLLDRTHIRFFGIRNVQQLFNGTGLKIIEAKFVVKAPQDTELAEQWKKLPNDLRAALCNNLYGDVYQIVVKAVLARDGDLGLDLMRIPI